MVPVAEPVDVVGWELPCALEECRDLGEAVTWVLTRPPGQQARSYKEENLEDWEDSLRVVAVRREGDRVVLVVCAERW